MSARFAEPILVTGAAGKTGLAVIRALAVRGASVRAFVRSTDHEERVHGAGASEIVVGNLLDVEAVTRAVRGTSGVYLICPNMAFEEPTMAAGVVAACRSEGVRRLVYHSVLHPQIEAMPHHWAKMRVEEALFESGLDWTILQPAAYMQNVLAGWREIVAEGRYQVPYAAETRLGMVDLEDVAEVAAKVLAEDGHEGAIYELAGCEILTPYEVAEIVAEGLGRPVGVEVLSREEWSRRALASDLAARKIETLVAMFRYYERHGFWGNCRVLTHLLGRVPTGWVRFVARLAARRPAANRRQSDGA